MFEKRETSLKFSNELMDFVEKWKDKEGNLIMILHKVQSEYGYIPMEVALELSKMLDVPLAKIYGVVTFYHFFRLKKPGKHKISVCLGTACYLKGGAELLKELEDELGIGVGETTEDGLFSLEGVRCLGCCGLAPVVSIDDEIYGGLTKEKLIEIISKYRE